MRRLGIRKLIWSKRILGFSLTSRILAINILALAVLLIGFFYLDRYQSGLLESKIESVMREGLLIVGALGDSVESHPENFESNINSTDARTLLKRLSIPMTTRVRLFDSEGVLVADSFRLLDVVQTQELTDPTHEVGFLDKTAIAVHDWIFEHLPPQTRVPIHVEKDNATADDFSETKSAMEGQPYTAIKKNEDGALIVIVALPVQALRRVQGAMMISTIAHDVTISVRNVRFAILEAFAVALGITILLSLYFARTIARPVRQLAEAAERVSAGHAEKIIIPDFTSRNDEIGGLSGALQNMTNTLLLRMNTIELFVADIAHEIKNPLSSLRNAVETAHRVDDQKQRNKLLAIVSQDVTRLDRLLSEIADASRIDTEMSRAKVKTVDIKGVLQMLVEMQRPSLKSEGLSLTLDLIGNEPFLVDGVEDRLVQVFQNLLSNAQSFTPSGTCIRIIVERMNGYLGIDFIDQGPGVIEDSREAIFDRFHTLRPKHESFGAHSGLGLSISRQIVNAHGGTIHCRNMQTNNGKILGACFSIKLPLA